MIRFLTNLGIALAIASTLVLIGATLIGPLAVLAIWIPKPWNGVAFATYAIVWFCVFMAAAVTLEDS
jgi:cytochrome b subunit of formate dehydrogenase